MTVPEKQAELVSTYMRLTKDVLPKLALSEHRDWPVHADHCFQRIVLDNICGGVWYDHLARPAYRHLSKEQAQSAVKLCEDIIDGRADLNILNQNSLNWRGKQRQKSKSVSYKP